MFLEGMAFCTSYIMAKYAVREKKFHLHFVDKNLISFSSATLFTQKIYLKYQYLLGFPVDRLDVGMRKDVSVMEFPQSSHELFCTILIYQLKNMEIYTLKYASR